MVSELGMGGMGVVYLAQHLQLGRPAALKMLLPQVSSDAGIVQRLFNEARAASAFDHPGISAEWKEALRVCVAALPALLDRTLSRFGDYIRRTYPEFERRFGPMSGLRVTPRHAPGQQPHEVRMDAQMVINTPALSGGTSVRGPHLDQPDKLISGLLYLRSAGEDRSAASCSSTPPPPAS